jgi:hypothetical protein
MIKHVMEGSHKKTVLQFNNPREAEEFFDSEIPKHKKAKDYMTELALLSAYETDIISRIKQKVRILKKLLGTNAEIRF